MKQIINAPESVVLEAIDGLVRCHAHLQRLDGFPDVSPYQCITPLPCSRLKHCGA